MCGMSVGKVFHSLPTPNPEAGISLRIAGIGASTRSAEASHLATHPGVECDL